MTLRHLKIFVAVCKENSITKAAKILYLSQPSVSFAISEIEKEYSVKLFERINQRLVITELGKNLYEHACQILNGVSSFEELAIESNIIKKINIGSSLTIGQYMIPKIINKIYSKYSDIQLEVKVNQTKVIESLVLQGEIDFGLVEGKTFSSALIVKPFSKDHLVAVSGINYYIEDGILSLNNLKNYKFILRERGSAARDYFDRFLEENKLIIHPYIESISTSVIISCLINNLGISILPHSIVKEFIMSKQLKIVKIADSNFERTYNIIYHKNKVLTDVQQNILNICLDFE